MAFKKKLTVVALEQPNITITDKKLQKAVDLTDLLAAREKYDGATAAFVQHIQKTARDIEQAHLQTIESTRIQNERLAKLAEEKTFLLDVDLRRKSAEAQEKANQLILEAQSEVSNDRKALLADKEALEIEKKQLSLQKTKLEKFDMLIESAITDAQKTTKEQVLKEVDFTNQLNRSKYASDLALKTQELDAARMRITQLEKELEAARTERTSAVNQLQGIALAAVQSDRLMSAPPAAHESKS
ncbi:MAG: hypothetical protein WCO78_03425 [Candidatus Roizmanbacteria bacterium]